MAQRQWCWIILAIQLGHWGRSKCIAKGTPKIVLVGGIPTPLRNMKVRRDHYSQVNGKIENVPNHQPASHLPWRFPLLIMFLHSGDQQVELTHHEPTHLQPVLTSRFQCDDSVSTAGSIWCIWRRKWQLVCLPWNTVSQRLVSWIHWISCEISCQLSHIVASCSGVLKVNAHLRAAFEVTCWETIS